MQRNYFEQNLPKRSVKQRHQTIHLDYHQIQSRKHSQSLMGKDERSHTLMSGFEQRRYSVYKTPTNAKKKSKQMHSSGSNNSRPSNYRKMVGSPFSKIKVKNLVEGGLFADEIKQFEAKVNPPPGYKILKEVKAGEDRRIFIAEKTSQKLIVFLQLNPTRHLLNFYKHFFHQDKLKRPYLKNQSARIILQPKASTDGAIMYSFQGQWPLQTELQTFSSNEGKLQIKDKALVNNFKDDPRSIKKIVLDVCKMLALLQQHKITHGNLRKSSLLMTLSSRNVVKSVRVYGFDNWFYFSKFQSKLGELINLYTPPEVLNFIVFEKQMEFDRGMLTFMEVYTEANSYLFDMWALGMILLELVLGFPLYLQQQQAALNEIQFEPVFRKDTPLPQIIQKQLDIIFSLDSVLKEKNTAVSEDVQIKYLLKMMLNINPSKRVSPKQVISYLS